MSSKKRKLDREAQAQLTRVTTFHPELIKALATVGTAVHVPEGWSIMSENKPADSFYILLRGHVEIRQSGQFLRTLSPGDLLGEIALVNHRLRSASAIAATDVTALHVDESSIAALSDLDPRFAETLRNTAASRLQPS